ncbi:MAG: ABC transporter permease, partial [Pseudomonadota bacterium]
MQDRHPEHAMGLLTGRGGLLRFAPPLTISLFAVPIVIGFAATLAPAFGYLPAIGGNSFSLEPWRELWGHPTVVEAATLSAVTGICATLLALFVVIAFCAGWHGSPWFTRFTRLLSPLLAVPHVAVAFGLVFLLAPSGWLVRAVSPWMTGFDRPPDWALAPDPLGISLVIGLAVKEIPFLLLMTLAALNQVRAQDMMKAARALGYGGFYGWMKSVFPSVYRQIRLPVYAVLAYSMSVVDVAAILAPTTPPPLAPLLLRWFNDPDLSLRFTASAGAILQTAMVVAAILVWALGERAVAFFGNLWIDRGSRGAGLYAFVCWRGLSAGLMSISTGAAVLGILGMAVWSVTRRWRFPDFLPSQYTLSTWMRAVDTALPIVWNT